MNNNDMIISLALGKPLSDDHLADILFSDDYLTDVLHDICDEEHASCNSRCPVYALNGNQVPDTAHDFDINCGCDCFKSGTDMLAFIRKHAR